KPANAMIADPDGEEHVYLTDFGLSVPVADANGARQGRWAGTPGYLAPEQIRGQPVDRRTDVYALGCVLYRALTGHPPFQGESEPDVLAAPLTARPPAVTDVAREVLSGFNEVVWRAMAKRPEDRYATAGELARAAIAVRFDVFLCHAPDDKSAGETIAA